MRKTCVEEFRENNDISKQKIGENISEIDKCILGEDEMKEENKREFYSPIINTYNYGKLKIRRKNGIGVQ